MNTSVCHECGAILPEGKTCKDYFERMITWDFEDFTGAGTVHHLTVLCYSLQHPSVYSRRGLEDAKEFLEEFVSENASFEEHDKRNRHRLSSSVRDWKIAGTPEDHGMYDSVPQWTIRTPDVAISGKEGYEARVQKWAESRSQPARFPATTHGCGCPTTPVCWLPRTGPFALASG